MAALIPAFKARFVLIGYESSDVPVKICFTCKKNP